MSSLPTPTRLPSGRHTLTAEDVAGAQRERILVATLTCVADRGYNSTTVSDIVARAAVSRSTFYAQFGDKEKCFIAAHGYAMDQLIGLMNAASSSLTGTTWKERLRSDLTTYLNTLADEPSLARTLHVEVLAAGPAALDHRAEMLGLLASQTAEARELARSFDRSLAELPPAAFALYVGGLDELIRDRLRTGSSESLRGLVDPVLEAAYALFGA
jgi:AcrR family transcriptional regulator